MAELRTLRAGYELVLSHAGSGHGLVVGRWRRAVRSRPGPAEEVGNGSASKLPQAGDLGAILPGDNQVVGDGGDSTNTRLSGRIPDGDRSLCKVGVPFALQVALVDLEATEVFILELDGNDGHGHTLSAEESKKQLHFEVMYSQTVLGWPLESFLHCWVGGSQTYKSG